MPRKKVLFIDDAESVLMLGGILLGPSYDVITASGGVDGIVKARAERPDLILLDLVMPGMDGLETCARLREDGTIGSIPIILVSACAARETLALAERAGFSDYLAKPISGATLKAKVEQHLTVTRASPASC